MQNFSFSDNYNGDIYYSLQDLYKTNLTKMEIGYTTSSSLTASPTYKTVTSTYGSVSTGITGSTVYIWVRLTYSDLGQLVWYTDKYGDRYSVYLSESSGGLACFTGDTKVLTTNGLTPIEEIQLNNEIETLDGLRKVTKKYEHIVEAIYEITVGEQLIKCSYSHPFVTERGTVIAKELVKGDVMSTRDKERLVVEDIVMKLKPTIVYEINTDFANTYYITDSNILVESEGLM